MNAAPARLVVLDRDGVINEESEAFIKSADEWHPLPGSLEAIAHLGAGGYTVVVASNQSGIGRGLFDIDALNEIHRRMRDAVAAHGGRIHGIFYCPHHPDDGCLCRKPLPGLLHDIAREYACELGGVPVIGDSARDLEAARAAGARPILVRTGNGARTEAEFGGVEVYDNLAAAAAALLSESAA